MIPTKEQLEQAIAAGMTQQEVADQFGCCKDTPRRHAKRHGLRWPNRAAFQRSFWADIDGERMTLRQAADRYGLKHDTVYDRYAHGKRGRDLVAPPVRQTNAPSHYDLDLNGEDWGEILSYARARTVNAASKMFDVPYGAITAAMRGEEHRLG